MPKAEVTKHDNEPVFEVGKAYKLTDGTKHRLLVQAIDTTRVKADDVEFNQHRYRAVNVEKGDQLSVRESALLATVSDKPCKVTKAELAKYEIESEEREDAAGGESPQAAEPDQTTSGNAQQREPEKAAHESRSGEAVSPFASDPRTDLTQAGLWKQIKEMQSEIDELRAFRDAIHEQWEHLELPAGVSLVAAVESVLEAERHERTEFINGLVEELGQIRQLHGEDLEKLEEAERKIAEFIGGENAGPKPRTGVFIAEGMTTYQVGRLVAKALEDNDAITVSKT